MAYRIGESESVQTAVRRIAREQLKKAIREIDDESLPADETIHEVRKRLKKVRGLLRLVRPELGKTYDEENTALRDAARIIADERDATSMLECYAALEARYGGETDFSTHAHVKETLIGRKGAALKDAGERLERVREALRDARKRAKKWKLDDPDGFAAVEGGLRKTYGRARDAMEDAIDEPTMESMHEWRKRVKYNRYHTRLLRGSWPSLLEPMRNEVKRLTDLLGDEHDLAVLRELLTNEADTFGGLDRVQPLLGLIDARRKELQAWAAPLGRRLFAEKPKPYAKRMKAAWRAARAECELEEALGKASREVYS